MVRVARDYILGSCVLRVMSLRAGARWGRLLFCLARRRARDVDGWGRNIFKLNHGEGSQLYSILKK